MRRCPVCLEPFIPQDPTELIRRATPNVRLPNSGNSCYINAIMQIFLHSDVLWSVLNTLPNPSHRLLQLKEDYCRFAGIGVNEQCDSLLFLNWLLEERLSRYKFLWSQQWKSSITCQGCGHLTESKPSEENIWILYPPQSPGEYFDEDNNKYDVDMENCVFVQNDEIIEGKLCEHCKTRSNHRKIDDLFTVPHNFFFNLQHFAGKRFLVYKEFELMTKSDDIGTYVLKGLVMHEGSQHRGHYKSFCLDKQGWTMYNDERITPCPSLNYILNLQSTSTTIPLLWYERKEDTS